MILPFPGSDSADPGAIGAPTEVRRIARMRCKMLTCEWGQVVDLSAQGMRIRHRGSAKLRPGEHIEITLSLMSTIVNVHAKIIWMRKTGFRKREIGMQFIDLSEDVISALTEITRCASKIEKLHAEHAA